MNTSHKGYRGRCRASTVSAMCTLALFLQGCGVIGQILYGPLATVDYVDSDRYLGKWYEIARYPNAFESEDCVGVTAEYGLNGDGSISVLNTCRDEEWAITEQIEGYATIADAESNAKLSVTFFPPFAGDYWILDLGEDYEYAVVGEPSRSFFWILSRNSTLDSEILDLILAKMPGWSYNPEQLYYVPQPDE